MQEADRRATALDRSRLVVAEALRRYLASITRYPKSGDTGMLFRESAPTYRRGLGEHRLGDSVALGSTPDHFSE